MPESAPDPVVIVAYAPRWRDAVLDISMRAWAPVFAKMQPAVQDYVYDAFYPDGWRARQTADIGAILDGGEAEIWLAVDGEVLLGWVGVRLHPEDRMGEVHIIAVDPGAQGKGVGAALMDHALARIREAGMAMVMVETGDDPGHAASRALYESTGFTRWPVARYFRKL